MATKKRRDPAFLFYDGDAARDVSHMTRLERGAYFDLIQAQRKFGGYTVEQARKILGKDFDEVWPSLELILSSDENGVYTIEWVKNSTDERKEHAEIQRKRIQDYWDKKKKTENSTVNPSLFHGTSMDVPLEDEDEDEDENIKEKESTERKRKGKSEFTLDASDPMTPILIQWLDYKRERKESYKSERGVKAALEELRTLSGNDPKTAQAIINQSFAHNWAGIFQLKNYGNSRPTPVQQPKTLEDYATQDYSGRF